MAGYFRIARPEAVFLFATKVSRSASGPKGEIVKICHRARLLVRRNKTTNTRKTNTAATAFAINYNSMESTCRLDLGKLNYETREWKQRTRAAKAALSTLLLIIHQTVLYYTRINYCRS